MTELTQNEANLLDMMAGRPEMERRAFPLLAKRKDRARFFEDLRAGGLLDPSRDPRPQPGDRPGSWVVPYWPALGYLRACAEQSAERQDAELGGKVMGVLRAAAEYARDRPLEEDNPVTSEEFAHIISILPTQVVQAADLGPVPRWLRTRFDKVSLGANLDRAIGHFLSGQDPGDWSKALALATHCLAWETVTDAITSGPQPRALLDGFWLKTVIKHHALGLGRKLGEAAASAFTQNAGTLFATGIAATHSWLVRPAVEEHFQNHDWRAAENAAVEALRDSILGWAESDPTGLPDFVRAKLLGGDVEMLRRIGIYLIDALWNQLRALYAYACRPELFQHGLRHELFNLLKNHYEEMDAQDKRRTVAAIMGASPNGEGRARRASQRRWLAALPPDDPDVALALERLGGADGGAADTHPDFNSYLEAFHGPGPSPYKPEEITALALEGKLCEKLNNPPRVGDLPLPTDLGLRQALADAVASAPEIFIEKLGAAEDGIPGLEVPLQYEVLAALRGAWKARQLGPRAPWESLITYFDGLRESPHRNEEAFGELVGKAADLLADGARDDEHAYDEDLLPMGWEAIRKLAEIAPATQQPGKPLDAMTWAINSPKGRVIEAAVTHALRECRLADARGEGHGKIWEERFRAFFDGELGKTADGNDEFSTLAASYLVNLIYLSPEWTRANVAAVFPRDRPENLSCALAGLAFSTATRDSYELLRSGGVLESCVRADNLPPEARKVAVQRVMWAYLAGAQTLEEAPAKSVLDLARPQDIEEAAWFLSGTRGSELAADQRGRITAFWQAALTALENDKAPATVLLALGSLAWALPNARGANGELLKAVAPAMGRDVHAYGFLEDLARLLPSAPGEIAEAFSRFLQSYDATFDYDDRLKTLIWELAATGQRDAAYAACAKLRALPGMPELAERIRNTPAAASENG